MGKLDDRAFGLDVSDYQPVIDYKKLKEDNVNFVICKASEGDYWLSQTIDEHIQGLYDNDIPRGVYIWHNPFVYASKDWGLNNMQNWPKNEKDPQIANFIRAVGTPTNPTKDYQFIMIDLEQVLDYYGKVIDPIWINKTSQYFAEMVGDYYNNKKVILYSGMWYINSYAKDMPIWMRFWPTVFAEYPYPSGVVNLPNIQEFVTKYDPPETEFPDTWYEPNPGWQPFSKTPLPSQKTGMMPWFGWQISGDKFTVPYILGGTGKPSSLDFNYLNCTAEEFYAFINYKHTTPIPPEPPTPPVDPTIPTDYLTMIKNTHDMTKKMYDHAKNFSGV